MNRKLQTAGWTLIGIAVLLMLLTASGMISSFDAASAESASASDLARGIRSALDPMMLGSPAFIVGLILVLVGWWRGR